MKLFKFIFITLVSFMIFTSCSKLNDFGGINNDPNNTTEPNTGALLTNVESGLGNSVWGYNISIVGGLYCQYFSETQYTEASRYATQTSNWDGFYSGNNISNNLYDLQNIINYNNSNPGKAGENGDNANQIAIARILKAYIFWYLTDTWGDLPYFDALKGNGNIKYDNQEEVYTDLDKELSEAVNQFVTPTVNIKGDILFNGNVAKWKKFGNSMRMLIALQLSKKLPSTNGVAAQRFSNALNHSAGVIELNSDNATIKYPGGVFNHPLYSYYNITLRLDYAMSETIANILNSSSDSRRTVYGSSDKGFPYGLDRPGALAWTDLNPDWSKVLHSSVSQPNSPIVIIGAANVYLARAEAAQLGWTNENVGSMYSFGIQRSWEQWGVYNASIFASYINQSSINIAGGNILQKINTQQWLAFYPNGTRGWSNWRRTGNPVLNVAPNNGNKPIPRRFPYGPNEPQLNPTNYATAAANYIIGGVPNSQDARVWWDQ